jgi:hypothetical protein
MRIARLILSKILLFNIKDFALQFSASAHTRALLHRTKSKTLMELGIEICTRQQLG